MTTSGFAWLASAGALALFGALPAAVAADCKGLGSRLDLPGVHVLSTQYQAAADGLPGHCILKAEANRRVGIDGKPYAIGFEMRLPDDWSGRFLLQENGGSEGEVVAAIGDASQPNAYGGQPALARGFAVLSSNGGHDGADPANAEAGLVAGVLFGLDPQARLDYGYNADAVLTPVAKSIIATYYGRKPDRSYLAGCSNGGRHAMVSAVRLASEFDGILAGAPGFNLPKAAIQHAWDIQSLHLTDPDSRKSFSHEDLALVADRILDTCDGRDGAKDGMVGDLRACQKAFDIRELACAGGKTASCLTSGQVEALSRMFAGPSDSSGKALYSDWSFEPGIAGADWRFWKIESSIPPWDNYPLIATMGAGSLSYLFMTPPTRTAGTPTALIDYLVNFDFDRDAPKIWAEDNDRSAMSIMTPPDADDPKLAAFQAHGGKLIVYHGQADGVFSVNDTIRWYERLVANSGGDASAFARLFTVPGMNHCSAGPAADQFDMLTALTEWVEKDKEPDSILAQVKADNKELPADWSKQRTRPLCVWPKIAVYKGGDMERADSFACEAP